MLRTNSNRRRQRAGQVQLPVPRPREASILTKRSLINHMFVSFVIEWDALCGWKRVEDEVLSVLRRVNDRICRGLLNGLIQMLNRFFFLMSFGVCVVVRCWYFARWPFDAFRPGKYNYLCGEVALEKKQHNSKGPRVKQSTSSIL